MLCSNCGKREVEVLIKQVVNQEVHNLNLCRTCAEEMGFISPDVPSITISFSLNESEEQKQKKVKRQQTKKVEEHAYDSLACPVCETEYGAFRETGLLGCPKCYESFRFPLGAYLQKEQGAESHWDGMSGMFAQIGVLEEQEKNPSKDRVSDERAANVKRLQAEIAEAVSREEYERAAELRDMLNPLLQPEDREEKDGS